MKYIALILLITSQGSLSAQKTGIQYRTVVDSTMGLHYLVFNDDSHCQVIFPVTTAPQAMLVGHREFVVKYQVVDDTISLYDFPVDDSSSILDQLEAAKFVKKEDGTLYDCISDYTYVDKKQVSTRHHLYVLDGELTMQKIAKGNGTGTLKRSPRQRYKVRRFVKKNLNDIYTIEVLKGKQAFDTYGVQGMNGVIKIVLKEK